MRIEPIENRPGCYTLNYEGRHFPVPLSALDLLILADTLEKLRPTLEQETRTLIKNSQRIIDCETLQALLTETDPSPVRSPLPCDVDMDGRLLPPEPGRHIRIDRHR